MALALVMSVPPTLGAIGAIIVGVAAYRQASTARRASEANGAELKHVETKLDGRLSELLAVSTKLAGAEGFREGRETGRARKDDERP